jgi:uncharacterized protein involved in exopolysaccharide biosynthesis
MSASKPGASRPAAVAGAPLSDWSLRPRYTAADFAALLWRERWLMLAIFLVLFAAGAAVALQMEKTFAARSSLLVRLGQEYVYQPRAGAEPMGTTAADINEVIQSEREILTGAGLRQRVIERLGYTRVFPDRAGRWRRASPRQQARMVAAGAESMGTRLTAEAAPDQNIIRVVYKDKDPERAALVLNAILDEYLRTRRNVFADVTLPAVTRQREAFENDLAQAEQTFQQFLASNGVGDFDAEKVALNTLYTTLNETRYRNQAALSQVRGRLTGQAAALNGVRPDITLYRDVDDLADDKLVALRVQREDLLTRYRPEAAPVREIDRQIAQFEAAKAAGKGQGEQMRRVGVNPIYQTVATDRAQARAEAASLERSLASVSAQLAEVAARRQRLATLEPRYQQLQREREVLAANVRAFQQREQQSQAAQAVAQSANDNVRVVERPLPPVKGDSLRGELLVLSFLLALATALAAAFIRIFLRRGFSTPSSAARTLDLPILATAPDAPRGAMA